MKNEIEIREENILLSVSPEIKNTNGITLPKIKNIIERPL